MWWGRTLFFPGSLEALSCKNSSTFGRSRHEKLAYFKTLFKAFLLLHQLPEIHFWGFFTQHKHTLILCPPPFPAPRSSVKQSSKISHIQSPWLVRVLGAPITHYPLLSWMNLYIAHLKKKIYVKCGHPQDIWCIVISSDGCLMRGYKRGTNKKRHGKVRCTLRAEEFFNKQCFTFFGWFGSMLRGRGSAANWMES